MPDGWRMGHDEPRRSGQKLCLKRRCRWKDLGDSLSRGRLSSTPQVFWRF